MKYTQHLVIAILITGLFSCKSESSSTNENKPKVTATSENVFNSEEFDYILPQPISLAKAFHSAGLTFIPNKANDTKNKSKYQTKVKQLINLGVYSTDLAYCAINGKTQEARNYLRVIQELGMNVGLKAVFSDKKMIEKFDKNLNNMESVEELIYEIQEKSEAFMDDNDTRYLSVVQFSGAWTEGMYLGIASIENQKSNDELTVTIVDQINILKNIIKGLKTYPNSDETLTKVITSFEDILATYDGFESVKSTAKEKTFVSPKLTKTEFSQLGEKIKQLRSFIIN